MISDDNKMMEMAFGILNQVYFEGELPRTAFTIQSSPKCYGYTTVQKVWADEKEKYHEINIGAEYISRPIEHVMATLLHEMVHLYCMVNEIKDTSNHGRYYNKRFKTEAEKRDLKIDYADYIGFSVTTPTERLKKVLQEHGLWESIPHCRTLENNLPIPPGNSGGQDGKQSSTRKYACPSCGMSIRATRDVNVICGNCMKHLEKVT